MKQKITFVNLTPHVVTFFDTAGNVILTVEPSGQVARCSVTREQVGDINGIPINKTQFGKVENLPEPQEGTIYIVSSLTAQAVPEREDVFITDDAVRDEQGRIIGCRALAHIWLSVTSPTNKKGVKKWKFIPLKI